LIDRGHKVAVLAVDPSSARTGGSILGDKTRMARLSASDHAYIGPRRHRARSAASLPKPAKRCCSVKPPALTSYWLETVGIGQSETAVCDMTDSFLALMLPAPAIELQGIKKGLVELADMIAINKADGDNVKRANHAAAIIAVRCIILNAALEHWHPPVITYSALTGTGLEELWLKILDHRTP